MLQALADRCARSTASRHLLFLIVTLISVTFVGYYFGTFDQAIHIPFLKKYVDPALYPNDAFFDLRFLHYSYFWFFFKPIYRLGILEPAMFAIHLLATYLTFWALWALSETLFKNALASFLTVVAFVLPHVGFAGFPVIEFSLLNRTFVLPFLLMAFVLYLRGRVLPAFLLLGVMYNLHVISVNFALAMILFDALLRFRQVGWQKLALGMGVFIAGALPVLSWKMGGSSIDLTLRPEWLDILARGQLYNLFYLFAPFPGVLAVTFSGLSTIALFFVARSSAPAPQYDRVVTHFVVAAILILIAQSITAHWLPVTIIIQSQIIRAGLFILIFAYIYFAHYIAVRYQTRTLTGGRLTFLLGALVLSISPAVLLLAWVAERFLGSIRWRHVAASSAVVATFATTLTLGYRANIWRPGIHVFIEPSPWYDVQVWARDHTATDAVFITPPQLWWFYEPEWRVVSERSTVVTLSELLEAAFAPEYLQRWEPRFADLAPGALDQFRGDVFANREITARAFYSIGTEELARIGEKYGATYLVMEKPNERNFPIVYENEGFVVYRLYDIRTTGR